jgi:hypothetical protein
MKVFEPTRISKTSSSCIDNIFTSNNIGVASLIDAGLSDHSMVLLNYEHLDKEPKQTKYAMRRSFSKKQIESFALLLEEASWDSIYVQEGVNNMFNEFMIIFNNIFNIAFPLKRKIITKPSAKINNWYTPELKSMSGEVIRLYSITKSVLSTFKDQNNYFCELTKYKSQIQENKRAENEKTIKQSNNRSRTAWELIHKNSNKTKDSDNEIFLMHNNKQLNCANEISNHFNIFFSEAATKTAKTIIHPPQPYTHENKKDFAPKCNKTFFLSPLCNKEFLEIIELVTTKKSAGFDDIPCHILKHAGTYLVNPLVYIINESFTSGIFPEILKKAVIIPLFKKGDKQFVGNYRPLSILSIFSKIIEKAFANKLISFLEKFSLMTDFQHGFRKGKSTITAISSFLNELYTALGRQESAFGIFYDFTKAFDMINHQLLISKLSSFGVRGIASNWIFSYLTRRTHITKITKGGVSVYSEEAIVNIGLPQGSILSPLLFILFTDDLPSIIQKGQLTLFADDTTYFLKNSDEANDKTNQAAVNKISSWVADNYLCLNNEKTVLLQFHPKKDLHLKSSPLIYLNSKSIKPQCSTKFLGLTLDINLSWNAHITEVTKKMASGCFLIKRIIKLCNLKTAKLVYHAYVHSRIS